MANHKSADIELLKEKLSHLLVDQFIMLRKSDFTYKSLSHLQYGIKHYNKYYCEEKKFQTEAVDQFLKVKRIK